MLREYKLLGRNSGKISEINDRENVPVNTVEAPVTHSSTESTRAPLHTIPEPTQSNKAKISRTPVKDKGNSTPERHGLSSKNRFGWAQKNELQEDTGNFAIHMGKGLGNLANMTTPKSTRTMGRANSTHNTPTKSVSKPPNSAFCVASGSRTLVNGVGHRTGNFLGIPKGIPAIGNCSTIVNTVDVPYFDLKEDPSFWMEHNVQVVIRVRPLNNNERSVNGYKRCLKQESAQSITWIGHPETRFTFDHVACEAVDQETLFRMVGLPMVENCLSGYHSCVFAYGQTGSGKTYTMLGQMEQLEVRPSPERGMTARIFEFLFARIRAEEDIRRDERLKYSCKCSFLEIYNEQITDLLVPSATNLQLREDTQNGVYVENLSEFEVETVGDILKLISQGSSNRKVATTNMNNESSRSHSVFTCVIESTWEKDATTNSRFARMNLVDLAGSERQKSSGAEGERLKEAANINKSLSTLGHVIMVLVDIAQGKPRHVPYRDSRLTFLLQDSLGGNSKTMIIANVSPSMCCAAETLNTLKFAQRAKLIQNNAVVNEDSSGDVAALKIQIRLLKEELNAVKRQNVFRTLSFGPNTLEDRGEEFEDPCNDTAVEIDQTVVDNLSGAESKGSRRLSSKQMKSLETTLAGTLRREQMSEISIKKLEAEIEQLNRLVRQREEYSQCTNMMLKLREEKIQRMESLVSGLIPAESYLLEENRALLAEIKLLQAKADKNPEVTRFAMEYDRVLEQVRKYQDFYEEGEREMLLSEVSELRNQLAHLLDGNSKQHNHPKIDIPDQLNRTRGELEECRSSLSSCLERNEKLTREIENLRASLSNLTAPYDHDSGIEVIKESIMEAPAPGDKSLVTVPEDVNQYGTAIKHLKDVMNLELEVDILKQILKEERLSRATTEEKELGMNQDLQFTKEKLSSMTRKFEGVNEELKEAKSIIEALEGQQLCAISELEDLRNSNSRLSDLVRKQEIEISTLKEKIYCHELSDPPPLDDSKSEDSPLVVRLKKMQYSLEKAKEFNARYQSDNAKHESNEEEMDEVRKQVEVETAEVIICLQDELADLQKQVQDSNSKETQSEQKLNVLDEDNKKLSQKLQAKEDELKALSEKWDLLAKDIEIVLANGNEALGDAFDQVKFRPASSLQNETCVSDQVERVKKVIMEKETVIHELNQCLEDASKKTCDLECMLRSLKGATLAITEANQQECNEIQREVLELKAQLSSTVFIIEELENNIRLGKEQFKKTATSATVAFVIVNRLSELHSTNINALTGISEAHRQESKENQSEILALKEELKSKASLLEELENKIRLGKDQLEKTSTSATVAFVIVNRLSELNSKNSDELAKKDETIRNLGLEINVAETQNQSLKKELDISGESCDDLRLRLSIEQQRACAIERELLEIEHETSKKLAELKTGVSTLRSSMNICTSGKDVNKDKSEEQAGGEVKALKDAVQFCALEKVMETERFGSSDKDMACRSVDKDGNNRDATITLLKKEFECAIESLKAVQAEMDKLHKEKDDMVLYERSSQEIIKSVVTKIISLKEVMSSFETQIELKMSALDNKLLTVEDIVHEFGEYRCQEKEVILSISHLESELGEAKAVAAQRSAEASCILDKFGKVQDTVREADIMINELMIANDTLKLEIEGLKNKEMTLIEDNDVLSRQVESLQSINELKHLHCENLEKQYASDLLEMKNMVTDLEGVISEVHSNADTEITSLIKDFLELKGQIQNSTKMINSWVEEIWSEIVIKDSAVSVLHLCHVGLLLETVAGLNVENGLLHLGISESNAAINELKEHNFRSRREAEMCKVLEGKLLGDIQDGFDRISRKEDEVRDFSVKLAGFQKKILDLQVQEEFMSERSDQMSFELSKLMKELEQSNGNLLASLQENENLLKNREEVLESLEEKSVIELCAKDFELQILASYFQREFRGYAENLENLNRNIIFSTIDAKLKEQILLEKDNEICLLTKEIEEEKRIGHHLLSKIQRKNDLISKITFYLDSVEHLDMVGSKISDGLNGEMLQQISAALQTTDTFVEELGILENSVSEIMNENLSLQTELLRKDDVFNGLQYDILLLQESASQNKDQKDEMEKLVASLETLENELAIRTREHDEAVENSSIVEAQLEEKVGIISSFTREISELRESINSLSSENLTLNASIQSALETKESVDEKLFETQAVNSALERENEDLGSALSNLNNSLESLQINLNEITCERDDLQDEVHILKKQLEMAEALADENQAIATEAQEFAESRKAYAEEKDDEVKLLEKSVEVLERTIDILENKVNMVKEEADRQRLEREELEMEVDALKQQTINVKRADADLKRQLDEKEQEFEEMLGRIQILEKELAAKDAEISQCKAHISELNLHAEAQARENKQKFKALEFMAEQVKPEGPLTHGTTTSSSKLEKNGSKARGTGSPFKCIGLGLSQQIKSEKDEELTASRLRIEELEALATTRQKEIFELNARLAQTGSMTHDLLRELSGLKLDMTKYACLLDNEILPNVTKRPEVQNFEFQVKDQEVLKLKQQLNVFVEERKVWLEEVDRKHAEMVEAQGALEELRQREALLSTENKMLKSDHANHMKKIYELEMEVKKLSGQQNLQQRIHHHAKIKEENNLLKSQNEELSSKLRKLESKFSIAKEAYRIRFAKGRKNLDTNFDEEHWLNCLLKEAKEEKVQLAQKLVGLCTSILKAAGTRPASDVSISAAEEALDQIKNRFTSLERELQDVKFKNRISAEKIRLSELMQQSPVSPRADENRIIRGPQSPFLSSLDR